MKRTEQTKQSFYVSGVCCATEEAIVRKHLDAVVGRDSYSFNPLTYELCLTGTARVEQAVKKLNAAGFKTRSKQELEQEQSFWERHHDGVVTGVAAIFAVAGMVIEQLNASTLIVRGMLLMAIVIGGWRIFVRAWKSIGSLSLDMNVLMSVAVIGSLIIGKWMEGASVIILFSASLMLESYSNTRTRRAIQSLMRLVPEQVSLVMDGRELLVSARDLLPGQQILVRPGERIPIDGVIVEGRSLVDQSAITGESVHIEKSVGAEVFAGSINHNGVLRVNVASRYEDTLLARMVHLVEEAQLKRAPVQNLVGRFARVYTPVVIVVAAVVAVLPPLLMHLPFDGWFYRALVLLVIACPCALVISTPVTIVSALARAARNGILVKGGSHIETLSRVHAIAFDKTGTLTEGRPTLTDIIPLNSVPRERLFRIIAALEYRSEHPLATAVMREVEKRPVEHSDLPVEGFEALPGFGVKGRIAGTEYFLGNHQLCEERGACSPEIEMILEKLEKEGKTTIVLCNNEKALCVLAAQDIAREQGARAMSALKQLGIHRLVLLSGDNELSARGIADAVGIAEYESGLLPQQKIALIEKLKAEHGAVAMVGDGINDAPALAASSVGIAMGVSGTDAALETADVVLMGDDLCKLPLLVKLSRDAMRIVKQNIVIALSLKALFIALGLAGVATLWMAVLADDGAALIVIFNGLRILSMQENS